ncbi:hypothetical protein GPECTOR_8g96 [Gonium pectorale]|uniref:Dynamin N-terminal domain-containing protein n=1 Tax=Gonium pectorale TaxID=33097 RepID=A0A150GTB2_GONPE|nr:hypothetical protein GPECTOR_8g96 [Gonium pectorale]|eukprot:KXZ53106.1 hypothetical protein GPECTOR_8g96 [Gonium pectorale]
MASASAAAGGLATTRKSIDDLLHGVGDLLADLTDSGHAVSEDPDDNEEARRLIDVELQRFWKSYYELKRRHDENTLSVAVLALTKSGKSTLLNALMGTEVLPMNNVPETARICRIVHDATAREPVLREEPPPGRSPAAAAAASAAATTVRGEAAVRARLQQLNSAARSHGHGAVSAGSGPLSPQSSGSLSGGGADCGGGASLASSVLHISAQLRALEGFGPELGRVMLLDTPGPNEAGEEQLKYQVERLLEGVDCVLYLLDYTKLKTAEEEGLFRRLRAINPQLVARLSSRLFFVINKVDASETSEGLDPDEVRNYVADLVTRQLGAQPQPPSPRPPPPASALSSTASGALPAAASGALPAAASPAPAAPSSPFSRSSGGSADGGAPPPFRPHPDQVLLLSARNALLARLVLSGRASPDALRRFSRLAFGAFGGGAIMGGGPGRGAAAGPSTEQIRSAAGCLLEGSGILDLEGRVLTFLAAHAGSVKLLATADDTARLLAEVRNVALACHSCLQRNVEALRSQAEAVRAELAEASAAFEEVRSRADAVQAEVVAEIKAHLNTLRRRLFTQIVQTLDPDGRSAASAPASAATAAAAPSFWPRVREKFLSLFTATSAGLPPQGPHGGACSGPSLVSEARSRSREELQALLLDLHDDLMGQIHSEVYDFWGVLEACAASRHSELLGSLNRHLAALSRRVEGAVSEALGVTLAPADIRLRPPSAEQLHSDVQELIDKGIRESTEKHIRVGTRTTTERVLRQPSGPPSLCRWGGYWEDVPRTRTVVETYTATVYSLQPDEIANHFIGLVDGAVTASERALGSYVGEMVERQLSAARERLRDYGDRYLGAMNAALAASSRGAECRSAALAAVEGYLSRLELLTSRVETAQRDAEAVVPGGAAGLMDEVEVYDDDDEEYGREYGSDGAAPEVPAEEAEYGAAGPSSETQEPELELELKQEAADAAPAGSELTPFAAVGAAEAAVVEAGDCVDVVPLPADGSTSAIPDIDEVATDDHAVPAAAADDACAPMKVEEPAKEVESDGTAEGGSCAEAVPSLQCLAGAAVEAPPQLPATADATMEEPSAQETVDGDGFGNSAGPAAVCSASVQPCLASPPASSAPLAPFSAVPFDYGRAFLEAMSSSEMGQGSLAGGLGGGHAQHDEHLTMIPLSADVEGGVEGSLEGAVRRGSSGGLDSPHSGSSEDWQLVEEGAGEAEAAQPRRA